MPQRLKLKHLHRALAIGTVALLSIAAAPIALSDCPPQNYTEEVGYVRCHRTYLCSSSTGAAEGPVYYAPLSGDYIICFECCTLMHA